MAIPARAASVIDFMVSGLPLSVSSPESGGKAPAIIFNNVDLPAPLAPTSPTTLPCGDVEIDVAKSLHHTEALAYPSGRVDDRHGATFQGRY